MYRNNRQLSGTKYVPARLDLDQGNGPVYAWYQLEIVSPDYVSRSTGLTHEHGVENVCIECIIGWTYDYEFRWARTAGGRALAAEMIARGLEPDFYEGPDKTLARQWWSEVKMTLELRALNGARP